MGKSKAPDYATTTTKTGGLFGESTNNASGSTFKPEDWQTNMGGLGSNLINQSLAGLSSNDYSQDPNFQVYQDNFNRGMQQAYDTNVLGNLTNRGLMRSSGLQAATNSFNNTMQQGLADLYDSYYNRQQNNLNSALNAQNTLYGWITGLNQDAAKNSQAVSNYNMEAYKADQAAKSAMFNSIMGAVGTIGGAALTGGASLATPGLSKLLSGGAGSLGTEGKACDFIIKGMTPKQIIEKIIASGIEYDQAINERDCWVHLSYNKGNNRKQVLKISS